MNCVLLRAGVSSCMAELVVASQVVAEYSQKASNCNLNKSGQR